MSKSASENDVKAIQRLSDQYAAAVNAGDATGFLATFSNDAVVLPPHEPALAGKENIRSWIVKSFFDPFKIQLTFTNLETEVDGNLAFIRGPYNLTLTPKAGGPSVSDTGKFLDIAKRQTDGSWKYERVMWSSNNPPVSK